MSTVSSRSRQKPSPKETSANRTGVYCRMIASPLDNSRIQPALSARSRRRTPAQSGCTAAVARPSNWRRRSFPSAGRPASRPSSFRFMSMVVSAGRVASARISPIVEANDRHRFGNLDAPLAQAVGDPARDLVIAAYDAVGRRPRRRRARPAPGGPRLPTMFPSDNARPFAGRPAACKARAITLAAQAARPRNVLAP